MRLKSLTVAALLGTFSAFAAQTVTIDFKTVSNRTQDQ